jgi:hypothetical protein
MDDPGFEARLGRWFADSPAFVDADWFNARVQDRLDRSWTVRRLLIGVAGLVGGVFAAGQMLGAEVFHKLVGGADASLAALDSSAKAIGQLRVLTMLPVGSEVLWVGAGLAVLAVVLMATRSIEEF